MGKEIELSTAITDIAAGPFGSNLKVECFVPSGFPIIGGANLKGYKVTDNITKFVTEEKARSLSRSIAHCGDVIVTISGTIGQIAYIPEDSLYDEYLCSQRQFRVSFDSSMVYVPYLVFYFHTFEGQNKILSFANQTGVPALSQPLKNFKKIRLCLPSLQEQRRIASIVETINDKIENNIKINDNLQQQLTAIYKSWYQDFSLVNDTELVETAYGTIPKGWHYVLLGDLCQSISVTHKFDKNALIFLNTGDVEDGRFLHSNLMAVKEMPGQAKKTIAPGDILYSEIRPINRHFAYVNFPSDNYVVSTKLMVIRAKNFDTRRLYHYLTSENVLNELQLQAESRSGTFPQIRFENVSKLPILIADEQTESEFVKILHTVFDQIEQLNRENKQLSELRDTLLPKLMSGEIDVSDIQL